MSLCGNKFTGPRGEESNKTKANSSDTNKHGMLLNLLKIYLLIDILFTNYLHYTNKTLLTACKM